MTRNLDAVGPGCRALNPDVFSPVARDKFNDEPTKADVRAEKELQRLCENELSRRGVWFIHLSNRAREKIGTPDILCCFWLTERGDFPALVPERWPCAVELKAQGGRLSDEQRNALSEMKRNGWHTYVCRTFDEFAGIFNGTTEEWKP